MRAANRPTAKSAGKDGLSGRGVSPAAKSTRGTAASASTMAATNTVAASAATASRTEQGLEITPAAGEFINFDVDTTYVMPFRVRNRSNEIQTLRFSIPFPPSTAFRLTNAESIRLSPGLSHMVEVEFMTHTIEDYRAAFTILKDTGGTVSVPLVAVTFPELEYPSTIGFGSLEQHRAAGATRPLRILNRCRRDAVVALAAAPSEATAATVTGATAAGTVVAVPARVAYAREGAAGRPRADAAAAVVSISPAAVVAQALSETTVMLELPKDVACGHHTWIITLTVNGSPTPRTVQVTADVVDSRSRLLDAATGLETVSVSFAEKTYEGTSEQYALTVSNGSAQRVSFAFQLANDSTARELPPFRLVPEQGHVEPKGSRQVTLIFEPPLHPVRTGWAARPQQQLTLAQPARTKRYEAVFTLLLVETEQSISFHVAGESCETVASVSESVLNFGGVPMNGTVTREFNVSNGVMDLPLKYAIDRVANFHVSKPTGIVGPGRSQTLVVTFQPRRLGNFREALTVSFNGGTFSRTVALVGRGIALNTTPGNTMMVTTVTTVAAPRRPHRPSPSVRMTATAPATLGATAVDIPKPVDMGMIPGQGLAPPRLPAAAAELNRQLHADDVALRHHTRSGGHVAPVAFSDTKALIKRVYGETPTNPNERRDCRRELMPMDLLKVSLPVKTLDFERITVGASAVRSLFVYNGTDGSILVAMPSEEEPHLRFSPPTQVVPPSRMGHFEVRFTGTVVQTVQQVVSFTLNTRYQMRVALRAEVAPVEVTLSRSEVLLNFGATPDGYATAVASGDPIVRAEVVMTNSGSSPAPFRWTLPPQSSSAPFFTIQPTHGVLAPMSKAAAEVVYAPCARDSAAESVCEALLSVEGAVADRMLRLVGVVAPTRCVWGRIPASNSGAAPTEEATVDLRLVAAGKEVTLTLPLVNKGRNDAFFSFESLPSDVTLTPAAGRVGAGETEELLISLCMPNPGTFQHPLVCHVCGMRRPLRLNLKGEVAAPPVTVSSPALVKGELLLDYGEIYAGSERVRSLRLANSGVVAAVIDVDLRPRSHHQQAQALLQSDPFAAPPRPDYYCVPEGATISDDGDTLSADGCVHAEVAGVFAPRKTLADPYSGEGSAYTGGKAITNRYRPAANAHAETAAAGNNGGGVTFAAEAPAEMELIPGLYRLTLPPMAESLVRIAYSPASAATTIGSATSRGAGANSSGISNERLHVRWRQIGAEETHPLPSLILQATTLPPKLLLRQRRGGGSPSPATLRTASASAAAAGIAAGSVAVTTGSGAVAATTTDSAEAGGTTRAVFPPVVAGRLPKPLHLELRNVSGAATAWRLRRMPVGVPMGSPFTPSLAADSFAAAPMRSPRGSVELSVRTAGVNVTAPAFNPCFLVEPVAGELAPGASETVTVTFLGSRVGSFTETYALVADDDLTKLCGRVTFTGTATEPQLKCEQGSVIFPTVPLGVEVRQTLYIANDGFDAIEVNHDGSDTLTDGSSLSPVSVRFPQGNRMTFHAPRIPVEVVFFSQRPITLVSSILLRSDKEGQSIEIGVRATAINSIVATEGYVHHNEYAIGRVADHKTATPGSLEPFKLLSPPILSSSLSQAPSGVGAGANTTATRVQRRADGSSNSIVNPYEAIDVISRTQWVGSLSGTTFVESLTSWLNGNILTRRPILRGALIEVLQSSYGSVLCDAIELLFGHRPKRAPPAGRIHGARARRGATAAATNATTTAAGAAATTTTTTANVTTNVDANTAVAGDSDSAAEPGITRGKPTTAAAATAARAHKGLASLGALTTFVRHYGGCLSSVQLPYLLPYEEYLALRREEDQAAGGLVPIPAKKRRVTSVARKVNAATTNAAAATATATATAAVTPTTAAVCTATMSPSATLSAAEFQMRTSHAWVVVTLEVVRVFYLSRLTPEALLKSIPSTHAAAFPLDQWASKPFLAMLSQSDVYSKEEGCVLLWIQWAANTLCEVGSPLEHQRITTATVTATSASATAPGSASSIGTLIFGSESKRMQQQEEASTLSTVQLNSYDDLHDVRPLIAAVIMYVPTIRTSFFSGDKKVISEPSLRTDFELNAELLMQVLGELGIVASARESTGPSSGSNAIPASPSWLPTGKEWIDSDQTSVYLFCAFLMGFLTRFVTTCSGPAAASGPSTPAVAVTVDGEEVDENGEETMRKTTASVLFQGKLLAPITRTIRIHNRTVPGAWAGPRLYRAKLTNTAFTLEQSTATVPANGDASITIAYTPRHHRMEVGQCLFVDETPALLPEERSPLILNLTVKPTDEPSRVFELETALYEPLQTEIPVVNPFTSQDCCVVSVRLSQEYDGKDPETGEAFPEADVGQRFSRAFFISTDVLPLRRSEEAYLPVHCIPMARGTFLARVTFREDREGEFSFLLKLRCTAPRAGSSGDTPGAGLEFRVELGETAVQTVTLRPTNAALDRALRLYEEKTRQQQGSAGRAPAIPAVEGNTYRVAFVNTELQASNPFVELLESAAGSATKVSGSELTLPTSGAPGELRFAFLPKYVGEYMGCILLSSPIDIRLLPFRGHCVPRGEQRVLRFACPARQHITQNITLVNSTEEDWLLSATFEEVSASSTSPAATSFGSVTGFSGPQEVRVLPGRRKDYTLKYSPAWITTEEERARLLLFNKTTGQKHIYDLIGVAEPPLSEDVIYVDCRAREARTVTLTVPNIVTDNCTYQMEASLPFADGERAVTITRGSFARYTLNIFPTVGGNYSGKVVFKTAQAGSARTAQGDGGSQANSQGSSQRGAHPNVEGHYVWFLVHLSVTPPEKEGTVVLDTDVRTPVVADVSITNPLAKRLTFAVRRYGAGLQGENTFDLEPSATGVYACTFLPSLIGQFTGRLSFFNDDVGEFWYEVRMVVTDSPAEELRFESPLGVPTTATIRLPNRSQQECQLMVHNTDSVNYSVSPPVLVIAPGSDVLVTVTYTPSAVGVEQPALLTFSHSILGRWRYACTGLGTPPADSAPRTVTCELGSVASVSLPFTNALDVDTAMSVTIHGADTNARDFFSVQRAPAGPVLAGARTAVVLSYHPREVGHHDVTLEVRPAVAAQEARYNVRWRFPIAGRAEWRDSDSPPLRLKCAARKRMIDTLELRAPGLTALDRNRATISFEPDSQRAGASVGGMAGASAATPTSVVNTSLEYALIPSEDDGSVGVATLPEDQQTFRVRLTFAPLRPIAISGDLVIRGGSTGGGIWRYRMFLEAPPAPVDDTITIASPLHTSTSVIFDLYNVFPYKSTFSAYFTPDSSRDLAASPAHGILLPFLPGQRGGATAVATPIKVSFRPSLRVPQVEGTLVVDTEDMQWSFRVVGKLESQKRPVKYAAAR